MRLHRGPLPGDDPALELALAHALVTRAGRGDVEEAVRIYRPSSRVVVFGRRDTRLPGFPAAAAAARAAGFTPLVRATGGRAVAYTDAVVVDHVAHDPEPIRLEQRFESFGDRFAALFRGWGVDARVGAVPGEYCPGAHSVNARGAVKLVGTAQRVVRHAWLFSSLVILAGEERIRPVLTEVYGHLGQPFDAASVGSLTFEVPGLGLDEAEAAVVTAYAGDVEPTPLDDETLALARTYADRYRV